MITLYIVMHIPEFIKTYGFILILVAAAFWAAAQFIAPPPPNHIRIASGSKEGAYYAFAQLYKNRLVMEKISTDVITTGGSIENIHLLQEGKADIAFVQSGLAASGIDVEGLAALSSLYFEPLWLFINSDKDDVSDIHALEGKKLAVGGIGGGTRIMAELLLDANDITSDSADLFDIGGKEAYDALRKGEVDAAFFVGGYTSPLIQMMLHDETIKPVNFRRAEAYARRFPYLSKVILPEGVVDLSDNIPAQDTTLISPVAMLVTRDDFHGALKTLLVQLIQDIHGGKSPYINQSSFPTLSYTDFPVSKEATRYYKYGPSLLQRYLPFWLADMVDRLKIMLIPLIGVMIPLFKIAPPAYRWRIRSKIYKWYKSLKKMEEALHSDDSKSDIQKTLKMLDEIDEEAKRTPVPLSYAEELYNLRLHIQMVRERIKSHNN